ncbi:histone H2B.1-like [Cryptomeria japonica]|uniref:histone H2B.1-like n=1 Tax=Cryptomeria japonica TaxID=3369 RepID=UPI0027DA4599|nr:histone H2B.1-like [Cryptomeria japonica]
MELRLEEPALSMAMATQTPTVSQPESSSKKSRAPREKKNPFLETINLIVESIGSHAQDAPTKLKFVQKRNELATSISAKAMPSEPKTPQKKKELIPKEDTTTPNAEVDICKKEDKRTLNQNVLDIILQSSSDWRESETFRDDCEHCGDANIPISSLVNEACKLAKYAKKNRITSREIQAAARLLIPGELSKHGVWEVILPVYFLAQALDAVCRFFTAIFIHFGIQNFQ